jgi:arginyl-tRNA synthetase
MILSEKELELSDQKDKIYIFPADTPLGQEITEVTRYENIELPQEVKIADEIVKRNSQVKEVLRQMEEKNQDMIKLWAITREWCLQDFREIYKWVGCRFDHYFHESDVGEESKQLVIDAYNQGILKKSDNAIGADLGKQLGFVVLLTSAGTGLYATKDLSLAKKKFQEFNIDRSIYVVDASQSLHFQQVFKTLELLGFKQASKCYHLAYGLVILPDGKMSSRKGNIIYFSQLRKLLMDKIDKEFMQKHREASEEGEHTWTEEEIQEATRKIAIATIKYGMLNQDNAKDIVFDLNEWCARTGNTGPYLMYAYTRTRAILRKIPLTDAEKQLVDYNLLTDDSERKVLTLLSYFSDTATKAAETYRPQVMCIYLYNLAKMFSRMYEKVPVKHAPTPALKATRLRLVEATGLVLQKGLNLLGIETVERM